MMLITDINSGHPAVCVTDRHDKRRLVSLFLMSSSSSSRPLYTSFRPSLNNVFEKAVHIQDMTNPVSLPSFYCLEDVPFLLDSM